MNPIDAGAQYGREITIGANQDGVLPLPARYAEDGVEVITRWELSDAERKALIGGADIMLRQMTFGRPLQPLMPWVDGVDSPLDDG